MPNDVERRCNVVTSGADSDRYITGQDLNTIRALYEEERVKEKWGIITLLPAESHLWRADRNTSGVRESGFTLCVYILKWAYCRFYVLPLIKILSLKRDAV
jgi:hypothetical protein